MSKLKIVKGVFKLNCLRCISFSMLMGSFPVGGPKLTCVLLDFRLIYLNSLGLVDSVVYIMFL